MDPVVEIVVALIALVLTVVVFLAQIRLFSIDRNLKQLRAELQRERAGTADRRCGRCNSPRVELYDRTAEGEGWVCRHCGNRWQVAAKAAAV